MIEPFDPKVAAARETINRSKDVEKSAQKELEQHRRWLKNYVAREARDRDRHLRRLELQRLKHERRLKRQHLIQVFRHGALAFGLFARSIGALLLNISITVAAWTGAKVQVFARSLIKLLSIGLAWLLPKARGLAHLLAKRLSIGLAWSRVKGRAFALWLFNAASIGFDWVVRKAHSLAHSLAKLLSIGLAWSHVKGRAFALLLLNAARGLARSLPKLIAATSVQTRRYRERSSALAVTLFEKARAGAQGLQRSAMHSGTLLRQSLAKSSASKNTSLLIKEGTAIAEPDGHFERPSQGEPLQHTGPGQEPNTAAAPLESQSPANNQVAPSASSTELQAADNQAPVEAPSSKGRKRRKRRRRNTPGDFRARQKSNSDAA
jgi:hypothetical protein